MNHAHVLGRALAAASFALLLAATAVAQQTTVRVRGTIVEADSSTIVVKSREGNTLTIKVADNSRIAGIVKMPLADIKPGSYVGSAAVPLGDGTWRALEVHLFPEAMRGTGEGHRPFDLQPQSTMTNATVADMVTRVDGMVMTLKHKDGEQTIVVPPDTPIVTYVPGDRSELEPGAGSSSSPRRSSPMGTLLAPAVSVGRDGLTPPM